MSRKHPVIKQRVPSTSEIAEFRKFLGPVAGDYADTQLRQLRDEMRLMAEILLDLYLSKQA